jgi:colanic acid biosynthesis glycosyl transferase WcaI
VDAAFDTGLLKNKTLLWVLKVIEKFIFKKADVITTISDGMKKRIISKGIDESRVCLFPNWIDIENIKQMEKNNIFRKTNLIPEDVFLVLYAGNIGEKQGVDIIFDVAEMTRDDSRIQYVIVGDGANRGKLKAMAGERGLANVKLLHLQPKEMLSQMLAAADLSLIIQKKSVGDIVMPSKLLNIMASARPVVATADPGCELTSFIKRVGCGITVVPEDPKLLKDAILRIYGDAEAARRYGLRARAYAEEHLSIENVLGSFDRSLRTLLNKDPEGFVQTTAWESASRGEDSDRYA